jgi:hypothetical protein
MRRDKWVRAALCAATLSAGAGIAAAGPDVIVGELVGSSNFGTVSGKAAFSIGTTRSSLRTCTAFTAAGSSRSVRRG